MSIARLLSVFLIVLMTGCAGYSLSNTLWKVSFPIGQLAPDEHVDHIVLTITHGHVAAIQHFPDDWNVKITQDDAETQTLTFEERHFASGLHDLRALDGHILIAASRDDPTFGLDAVITTESPDRSGRAPRSIELTRADLLKQYNLSSPR